jgi:hypothetical protein
MTPRGVEYSSLLSRMAKQSFSFHCRVDKACCQVTAVQAISDCSRARMRPWRVTSLALHPAAWGWCIKKIKRSLRYTFVSPKINKPSIFWYPRSGKQDLSRGPAGNPFPVGQFNPNRTSQIFLSPYGRRHIFFACRPPLGRTLRGAPQSLSPLPPGVPQAPVLSP